MKKATQIVNAGRRHAKAAHIVNPPVYHASTVLAGSLQERWDNQVKRRDRKPGYYYGRSGSPTARTFEEAVAELEGGYNCTSFCSGLAAVATALTAFLKAGDHILMTDGCYQPTRNICNGLLERFGIETTFYAPRIGAGIADLIRPNTKVVYLESPSTLTFEVQDLPAIAAAAHAAGARVLVDNTWASPLYYQPLALGADVVIEAATKYLVGHSDAMLGAVVATEEAWPEVHDAAGVLGQCAGPDDLYLGHRGIRTLGVRMARHQETALTLACWLEDRPEVVRVLHPGLESHPDHALWRRDFTGSSGLFSFELPVCSKEAICALIDTLHHFPVGASWGGYESLAIAERPTRAAEPWDGEGYLVRLHAGLEDADDLIADLEAGFTAFAAAR